MPSRPPERTHAYLVGGGIASLAAAIHLYHDAGVQPQKIHILEAAPHSGGSIGGPGSARISHGDSETTANSNAETENGTGTDGYVVLATRKLNFSFHCLYATLSKVPSLRNPGKTVLDDVRGHVRVGTGESGHLGSIQQGAAAQSDVVPPALPARLVANGPDGPEIVDVQNIGLLPEQRIGLLGLIVQPEDHFADGSEIQEHFKPDFFESKFWDVWASLYGFMPWHSTIEFRRYLLRFLHEFPHISTLEGTDYAPLNDYECIVLPMERYLVQLGVDFQFDTYVSDVVLDPGDSLCVRELRTRCRAKKSYAGAASETTEWVESLESGTVLSLGDDDIVLITLGSVTAGARFGANDRPPKPMPSQSTVLRDPGPVWRFWSALANPEINPVHHAAFGRPQVFYGSVAKSSWLSFTITLRGAATRVFDHLAGWGGFPGQSGEQHGDRPGNPPSVGRSVGRVPLITFRDSPWMLSLSLPHQPYFSDQPDDVRVLWGYGLYPDQEGLHVRKQMLACTGAEIYEEVLSYLRLPDDVRSTASSATTIPCLMPFVGSPYLQRQDGDRPAVVPEGSVNLGLLGQFVEIERDVTSTMEYSVRSAQMAVATLMGLEGNDGTFVVPPVHRGDRDAQVLGQMLLTIMT